MISDQCSVMFLCLLVGVVRVVLPAVFRRKFQERDREESGLLEAKPILIYILTYLARLVAGC